MNILSFRAETQTDVDRLQDAVVRAGFTTMVASEQTTAPWADVDVQMKTQASLEEVRALMATVDDGHVMAQTLRQCPLKDNPLTRDALDEQE